MRTNAAQMGPRDQRRSVVLRDEHRCVGAAEPPGWMTCWMLGWMAPRRGCPDFTNNLDGGFVITGTDVQERFIQVVARAMSALFRIEHTSAGISGIWPGIGRDRRPPSTSSCGEVFTIR